MSVWELNDMNNYEKIQRFIKNSNSIITIKEFERNNVSYYYINKLIEDNYIIRIGSGMYAKTDSLVDPFYSIQQKIRKGVFSYNTALYLLGKTEVIPHIFEITVPRTYHINQVDSSVKIHYTNNENLTLGAIKVESPYGKPVMIYNLERTICDIVKNKSILDREQINKVIRNAFAHGLVDGKILIQYSKRLKCEKKIRSIIEVMF